MPYGKMFVVLLNTLAAEKDGSTNAAIAQYLLQHRQTLDRIDIRELAASCHVGIGTISRFCREIGLDSFAALKEMLSDKQGAFAPISSRKLPTERIDDYADSVEKCIRMTAETINPQQIHHLCKDIFHYQKVAVFGMLKAESAAQSLQSDLLELGKQTYTRISYVQQINYLKQADEQDLIIIFSYNGIYFDYAFPHPSDIPKKPNICFITGGTRSFPKNIHRIIRFASNLDHAGHPYQLQFVSGIISQEYARMIFQNTEID